MGITYLNKILKIFLLNLDYSRNCELNIYFKNKYSN